MNIYLKYFIAWFPMLILAVLNGTARDLGYKEYVGELMGHQISTITLIIIFAIYNYFTVKKIPPKSKSQAISLGIFWMSLTLLFEFGFGRLSGKSWDILFSDYNIFKGQIWILIPLWLSLAPYLFYSFFKKID